MVSTMTKPWKFNVAYTILVGNTIANCRVFCCKRTDETVIFFSADNFRNEFSIEKLEFDDDLSICEKISKTSQMWTWTTS